MELIQKANGLKTIINKLYLIILFIFFLHNLSGQEKLDSLIYWSDEMLNDTSENIRMHAFNEVRNNIYNIFNQNKNNFNLDFSKVKSISSLQSEDKKCRIITYNLRKKEAERTGTHMVLRPRGRKPNNT